MSDEKDRWTRSLVPSPAGAIVVRSTSLIRRGLNLLDEQKPTEDSTIRQLRRAAEQDNATAQFNLGVMYHTGQGVPQDDAQAVQWWRKAAEQGDADAQVNLGWSYESGRGVPQDYAQAVESYRKAAERGYADAQCSLGHAYLHGRGIQQDDAQAVQWYRKAAEQGHTDAQTNLGWAYVNGRGVPPDNVEAAHWWRKAAEHGHADAQCKLGWAYAEGRGMPQDYAEAVQWFGKAAAQGNADAQWNLGYAYFNGLGVPQDDAQAAHWWLKAAEQGEADAQCKLGWAYANGRGVPQDDVEAHKWYNLAVSRASGGDQKTFADGRDAVAKKMTPDQLSEAQMRARVVGRVSAEEVSTMLNKQRVFDEALQKTPLRSERQGTASLTVLKQAFDYMKSELERLSASSEDCGAFVAAIGRAIDEVPRLKSDERAALRDVLQSAFDGMPRKTTVLAVKCDFLDRVRL